MAPPLLEEWIYKKTPSTEMDTGVRVVEYENSVIIFVFQGSLQRISSWVEGKVTVDALSGQSDVTVNVLFGDRDDIWNRVIVRRAVDVAKKKNVLLGISLVKECKNEIGAQEVSSIVMDALRSAKHQH